MKHTSLINETHNPNIVLAALAWQLSTCPDSSLAATLEFEDMFWTFQDPRHDPDIKRGKSRVQHSTFQGSFVL